MEIQNFRNAVSDPHQKMDGMGIRRILLKVADLITEGRLTEVEEQLRTALFMASNWFTGYVVASYEFDAFDTAEHYATAMILRETEVDYVNKKLKVLMKSAEKLAVSHKKLDRASLALWFMARLMDTPEEMQREFEYALAVYDQHPSTPP